MAIEAEYKVSYEELRSLVRLYFEIVDDDGTFYTDEEWYNIVSEIETDLRVAVGLLNPSTGETDVKDSFDYP